MFKKMKHLKNQKGLTLIELLAVIVILAIIAAIAIPAIGNIIENSRYKAVKADAINVLNAANVYFTENSSATTVTVQTLNQQGFLDTSGKIPATSASVVTKGTELELDATVTDYSGTDDLEFRNATVTQINANSTKVSLIGS